MSKQRCMHCACVSSSSNDVLSVALKQMYSTNGAAADIEGKLDFICISNLFVNYTYQQPSCIHIATSDILTCQIRTPEVHLEWTLPAQYDCRAFIAHPFFMALRGPL